MLKSAILVVRRRENINIVKKVHKDILYKPLFSRTVIFAFLDFCGNSRVVNFAIFLMLSLL